MNLVANVLNKLLIAGVTDEGTFQPTSPALCNLVLDQELISCLAVTAHLVLVVLVVAIHS